MHTFQLGLVLSTLVAFANVARSDEIHCASKAGEQLYFTEGQLRLVAEVSSPTLLSNVSMTSTGSEKLGIQEDEIEGKVKNKYVRFAASDAWCDYRLATFKSFSTAETQIFYLDAACEEGLTYSIKLYCRID